MRRDELYLRDMVEASVAIAQFISNVDGKEFVRNDLLRSATLHKLSIIGEAAVRLSEEIKSRYPDVEWRDIIGFRNIAVHAYFSIKWSIVWVTATEDVPVLSKRVSEILSLEYPNNS